MPKPSVVLSAEPEPPASSLRAEVSWSGHAMLFTLPFPGGYCSLLTSLPQAEAWALDLLKMVQDARVDLAEKELTERFREGFVTSDKTAPLP